MVLPFCKFYPRDWMADTQLRSCSYGARGLWADLLCLMAMNESGRGFLELSGKPLTEPTQIARLTNGSHKEVAAFILELEQAGVFSRDERGCIFSRRMVQDKERSERAREDGRRGGNPQIMQRGLTPPLTPPQPKGLTIPLTPSLTQEPTLPLGIGLNSEPRSQNPDPRSEDVGQIGAPGKASIPAQPKRSAAVAAPASTDEEWLEGLSKDPTYAWVDVRREHGKMTNWCKANGRQPTRRRFVNWLNRVDKPMTDPALHNPRNNGMRLDPTKQGQQIAALIKRTSEKLSTS